MKKFPSRRCWCGLLLIAVAAVTAGCATQHPEYVPELGLVWRNDRVGEIVDGRFVDPLNRFSLPIPERDPDMQISTRYSGDRYLGILTYFKPDAYYLRIMASTPRTEEEKASLDDANLLDELAKHELTIISRNFPKARMIYDDMIDAGGRNLRFSCYVMPTSETAPPTYRGVFFFVNDGTVYTIGRNLRSWKEQDTVVASLRLELEKVLAAMEFPPPAKSIFNL